MSKLTIETESERIECQFRQGLGLQAICAQNKTPIEFDCRKADCGICIFKVVSGADRLSELGPRESDYLTALRADADERLACQTRLFGDVHIKVETQF